MRLQFIKFTKLPFILINLPSYLFNLLNNLYILFLINYKINQYKSQSNGSVYELSTAVQTVNINYVASF